MKRTLKSLQFHLEELTLLSHISQLFVHIKHTTQLHLTQFFSTFICSTQSLELSLPAAEMRAVYSQLSLLVTSNIWDFPERLSSFPSTAFVCLRRHCTLFSCRSLIQESLPSQQMKNLVFVNLHFLSFSFNFIAKTCSGFLLCNFH